MPELPRVACCSSICFRFRTLTEALALIAEMGFSHIDLGALPGVCEHIPLDFDEKFASDLEGQLDKKKLSVVSINLDPGPLNDPNLSDTALNELFARFVSLASRLRAAIVIPNGAQSALPFVDHATDLHRSAARISSLVNQGAAASVDVWVEAPHFYRFINSISLTAELVAELPREVGLVLDLSHVTAGQESTLDYVKHFSNKIKHVHLRDAVPGNINLSLGNGSVQFAETIAALESTSYSGFYSLELESHDIEEFERFVKTQEAGELLAGWLQKAPERG